jgi:hypothetical protein
MAGDERSEAGSVGAEGARTAEGGSAPDEAGTARSAERREAAKEPKGRDLTAKGREAEPKEDPEEYGDPICVCEAEPYWREVAERLERERGG